MSREVQDVPLDKIYAEAGQWIRMCNTIIWSIGAFLITLSMTCVGLALNNPSKQRLLAVESLIAYAFWLYVSMLFRSTAAQSRSVLIAIERHWNTPNDVALYTLHGQIGMKWYSVFNMQVFTMALLVIFWSLFLARTK